MVRSLKDLPFGLGPRTALFLREVYPYDRAKSVARDFRVSPSTAQRWLDGHAPTTFQLEEMFAKWGMPLIQTLFAEAFASRDGRVMRLQNEHNKLYRSLGHPSDPLEAARKKRRKDPAWPSIWAPSPEATSQQRYATDPAWPNQQTPAPGLRSPSAVSSPPVQYSARDVSAYARPNPEQVVPYLIGILEETIKEPTILQRLAWRLGF